MEVVARYAGYGGEADMAWKVGRIMLKYRPIAPKPVTGGAVTPAPLDMKSSSGRGKRKGCSKEGRFRRGRKSTKKTPGVFSEEKNYNYNNNNNNIPVVTLPLMPVTPERKEEEDLSPATPSPTASDGHVAVSYFGPQSWKRVGSTTNSNNNNRNSITGVVVAPRPVRPVGSWVTVECVTYTWQEGDIPADLEGDTCPVFFSDARGERVTWTNEAYRRMVVGPSEEEEEEEKEEVEGDGGDEEEVRVALVTRGMVPPREEGVMCFTCRVRVRYTCRRGGKVSMAAPCDVWRMASGGLAWRLDVKAALSLSLGS